MNATNGTILAARSGKADTFLRRGLGLMGKRALPDGGGLVIQPCNGVVSFFMRFPIDVLFVGGDGKVCKTLPNLRPWKASKIVRGSKFVVELPAGTIEQSGTQVGDAVTVEPA
jgi:uncharacterized membrane protein (UPF0127 family)